jgi:pilus assembly protein CpaC
VEEEMKNAGLLTLILILPAMALLCHQPVFAEPGAQESGEAVQVGSSSSENVLRVFVGKSLVVKSAERLSKVSVTDPNYAEAVIISPKQVLIHGKQAGTVTLILWDEEARTRSFDLQVEIDLKNLQERAAELFPSEKVKIAQLGSAIVLTGEVTSETVAETLTALAETQSRDVVSMLGIIEKEKKTVLLQVRFAELNRQKQRDFGINLFSLGATNTIGTTSTGQFGGVRIEAEAGQGTATLTDLLNVFIFRPDLNVGATIKALASKGVLQILAEPNVLALDGSEASFLAGGEFPFPTVQGGTTSFTSVTVQFREFGVRLSFTPTIKDDGNILLKVAPEVSSLDFANALVVSGFLVPALTTRKAETEVSLRDGQSFSIAGLIDNRLTESIQKIPALGDIPFLGNLFKSKSFQQQQSELVVLVTPRIVEPLDPGQLPPLPGYPKPFMDTDEFDGEKIEGKVGEVSRPADSSN